jgi:hypothetical protein
LPYLALATAAEHSLSVISKSDRARTYQTDKQGHCPTGLRISFVLSLREVAGLVREKTNRFFS